MKLFYISAVVRGERYEAFMQYILVMLSYLQRVSLYTTTHGRVRDTTLVYRTIVPKRVKFATKHRSNETLYLYTYVYENLENTLINMFQKLFLVFL